LEQKLWREKLIGGLARLQLTDDTKCRIIQFIVIAAGLMPNGKQITSGAWQMADGN
jgi:hypothetical protein